MTNKRLNQWLAEATGLSRRAADEATRSGRVHVNNQLAQLGQQISQADQVKLDGKPIQTQVAIYIAFHKPIGYVCSKVQQGKTPTIYKLLPQKYQQLKSIGRLDKESSGLLVLTNDGVLANQLMHPSAQKLKVYNVELNKPLADADHQHIQQGVSLEDGPSRLELSGQNRTWTVQMREGRNRQIRRTFEKLGYNVKKLHRIQFGGLELGDLKPSRVKLLSREELL
jgi:23S rRNA pseudouridine2605 synthase